MKSLLTILFLVTLTTVQAQDLPPHPESGKCYIKCKVETGNKWLEIPCELMEPEARKVESIEKIQRLYKDLGYDVEVTGIMDLKTIEAYKDYHNGMKQLKRKKREAARRAKRKKKT